MANQREAEAAVEEIMDANGRELRVRADATGELDVERLFDEAAAAVDRLALQPETPQNRGN